MRNAVSNVIGLVVGAILICLALTYMTTQYKALSILTNTIAQDIMINNKLQQQYSLIDINQVSDKELIATIMGYREYPIMVDDKIIPLNGHDYNLYITYVRDGFYKKEYQYEADRRIFIIHYEYIGM